MRNHLHEACTHSLQTADECAPHECTECTKPVRCSRDELVIHRSSLGTTLPNRPCGAHLGHFFVYSRQRMPLEPKIPENGPRFASQKGRRTDTDTDRVPSHTSRRDRRDDQHWRTPSRTFSQSAYDESPARCWRPSVRLERARRAPDQGRRAPIAH